MPPTLQLLCAQERPSIQENSLKLVLRWYQEIQPLDQKCLFQGTQPPHALGVALIFSAFHRVQSKYFLYR